MQQSCKNSPEAERGAVLIIMVIALPVLLILASVAIDLGNYYRQHVYLQNAADAGVLAGMGYAITQRDLPPNIAQVKTLIEGKAKQIAIENLRFFKVNPLPEPNADYDTQRHTLSVSITTDVAPLFGFFKMGNLTAAVTAESERKPANIHLALDFSASMLCPRNGACTCLTPQRTGACDNLGVPLVVDDLRAAVAEFIQHFDPSLDRIGASVFNMVGEVAVPIAQAQTTGFNPVDFDVINTAYQPRSNSNISDGLIQSLQDLYRADLAESEEFSIVLVSDAAPSAGRFFLDGAAAGASLAANSDLGLGDYDYTSYAVQWQNAVGPSLLVKTQMLSLDYSDPNPPLGIPGQFVPDCSPWHRSPPSQNNEFDRVFSSCVPNLGFRMPFRGTNVVYGSECGQGSSFKDCFLKQYYHTAVQVSDRAREAGGTVYAIGLGRDPNFLEDFQNNDPYQDVKDVHVRKEFFMSRIANDYLEAVNVSRERFQDQSHPEFQYRNYNTYSAWQAQGIGAQGRYYGTPTSAELSELFSTIARRILLRLTK